MPRGLAGYRLLRGLARGGQGDVFLALDERLRRRVCIKLYRFEGGVRERRAVEREAWRLAGVRSPGVLEVFDVVAHAGRVGLVTRYVAGCDLEMLLRNDGRLAPEEAVSIASEIAAALAALRRSGIVHGDLAARNILIDEDGRAVIGDFGSAVTSGAQPRGVADVARSPEHERGEALTPQSDFFALGLLLQRMLTGQHPFHRNGALDRRALLRGLKNAPELPNVPPKAGEALSTLLLDLLAARPEQRPSGTFELRERLRVLRAALPPPRELGRRAAALGQATAAAEGPLRLPGGLVTLPWWRGAASALKRYWAAGSVGARALLIAFLALPVTAGGLALSMPGPCIDVLPPTLGTGARRAPMIPGGEKLREILTSELRRVAADAMLLGAGPDSDDSFRVSPDAVRAACVADRSLSLRLECVEGLCRIETAGRRFEGQHIRQLDLPVTAPQRDFLAAIRQLVADQASFLR